MATDTPFQGFGRMLREYRESYGERMRSRYPGAPRLKLTALALIQALDEQYAYHLTSGAYSEIEAGLTLPRDLPRFVEAVTAVLGIEKNSADYHRLVQQLAYDVVSWRAGPDIAGQTVPRVLNMAQVESLASGAPSQSSAGKRQESSSNAASNAQSNATTNPPTNPPTKRMPAN